MAGKVSKNKKGYGYKYADIAQIHNYLESINASYWQYIEREEGDDYIYTVPTIDGVELPPRRGCRVVQATLSGKSNPAQEQGSALTYARRYSLLLAFGLATDDDDGETLTKREFPKAEEQPKIKMIDDTQVTAINELLKDGDPERVKKFNEALTFWGAKNISELNYEKAKNLIKGLRETK